MNFQACWATLAQTYSTALADPDNDPWVLLAAVPIFGLMLAVLLAPAVQAAYGRKVKRFMGFREVAVPPSAWWARRQKAMQRPAHAGGAASALPLAEAMRLRAQRVRRATLAAYAVFVLGTLAVAPLMEDMAVIDVVLAAAFVAVLMAGPALVHVAPHGSKRMLLFGSVGITALVLWLEGDVALDDALVGLAVVLLMYVTSVHRTMRALVVPLLVLCGGALVGTAAAIVALQPLGCIAEQAEGSRAADWALLGASTAAAALVFVLCLWLAGRALELLAWVVQRGWMSDLTLVAASAMVLLAGLLVLATDDARATPAVKLAMFAAWVLAPAAVYAWALHRQPRPEGSRRLLMLRVFSHDRRAERMLDTIQSRWQFAGPVMEIGGPDLVKLNLDLQEFVAFATFRLHELFQPAAVPRDTLAASLDLALDREGRFRVNELFCFDTSWRGVVDQLIGLSDVVLLDLRGFNPQRKGTAHEVGRLAALGMLARVVAVGDARTDWSLVENELRRHGGDPQALWRIDSAGAAAQDECLDALVRIADGDGKPPAADAAPKASA